jgi:hypothetical protein
VYSGEWLSGVMDGSGLLRYANGECYDGQWSEGQPHGQGCFTDINGDLLLEGIWEQGEPQRGETALTLGVDDEAPFLLRMGDATAGLADEIIGTEDATKGVCQSAS